LAVYCRLRTRGCKRYCALEYDGTVTFLLINQSIYGGFIMQQISVRFDTIRLDLAAGVFSIALATAFGTKVDEFGQTLLRNQLVNCGKLSVI